MRINGGQLILYILASLIGGMLAFIPFTYIVPQMFFGELIFLHIVFILVIYIELSRIIEWFEGLDKLVYINSDESSRMKMFKKVISIITDNLLVFSLVILIPWIIIRGQYLSNYIFIGYFLSIFILINTLSTLIMLINMAFIKDKLISILLIFSTEIVIILSMLNRLNQIFNYDLLYPVSLLISSLTLLFIVYYGWNKWI
ncbi:hypothetical protein Smar_1208 [Staphylothermus marinus F1]|uniref:Uncharacterized protein n=2 Tax=Staphylothermus marinus TaxID=2280 RepID=A3DNU3_STAMF|nr:hypothetical protein Smar_1208 [Staphylothermus marinus F1]